MKYELCPECGVPKIITQEHIWLNNGDIVHKRARSSRMLFLETESLDPLFRGIAKIIGTPIEHMVITVNRRAQTVYLRSFIPKEDLEKIRKKEMDYESWDAIFRDVGNLDGVGDYSLVGRRYERDDKDFDTISVKEPYSVPMAAAAHIGAVEALTGIEQGYSYKEVSPNEYHVTTFPSPHPEGLSKRLWFQPYEHEDGDLELERCGTCGGPKALSEYHWYQDRGLIINTVTKKRVAIMGYALLDPVFSELEAELGDTIPSVVVEAQRRFTKRGFDASDYEAGEEDFRTQLALRGLGNLKELSMKRKGMHMRVDNVNLHLILIGMAQCFFEVSFGLSSSNVDWHLSEEGGLEIEVTPR